MLVCWNDGITDEKQIGKRLKKEDGTIHDAASGRRCIIDCIFIHVEFEVT